MNQNEYPDEQYMPPRSKSANYPSNRPPNQTPGTPNATHTDGHLQQTPNPPAAYPPQAYSLATVAVAEQLAQWQTTFETARPITYSTIDDGNYIAQITDVSFRVERGIPWMVYELMICDAMEEENKQCIGMTIEKRRKLENDPRSMGYLKGELEVCGVRIQRASEIPQHFAAMRGIVLGIRKTTSGKYFNIYLNHQIDPETGTPITHRR